MCDKNLLNTLLQQVADYSKEVFGDKLKSVILYGSYSRGDYDEESDIDIMVVVDCRTEDLHRFRHMLTDVSSHLSLEYGVTVSVAMADTESFNRYGNFLPFYININREGIKIA